MIGVNDFKISCNLLPFHHYILIFELFYLVVILILGFISAYIHLVRIPMFHIHVRIILGLSYVYTTLILLPGIFLIVNYFVMDSLFLDIRILLEAVRSFGSIAILGHLTILTAERIWATLRIDTYEKKRNLWFVSFALFLNAIICASIIVFLVRGTDTFFPCLAGIADIILSSAFFYGLVLRSVHMYENRMSKFPLPVRFQLSENVRLGRIISASLRYFCFFATIALLCVIIVTKVTIPNKLSTVTFILHHIFDFSLPSAAFVITSRALFVEKRYKQEFKVVLFQLLPFLKRRKSQSTQQGPTLFTLTGRVMVLNGEGNQYFNQLESMWNTEHDKQNK